MAKEWKPIKSNDDLPPILEDVLWSFSHLKGSRIGSLETTRCFIYDVQYHGEIEIEYALAWMDIPQYIEEVIISENN